MEKINRFISVFSKRSDEKQATIPLSNASLDELKAIFKPRASDPFLLLCYDILEHQAFPIEKMIGQKLDLENFDYFLDCEAL